MIMKNIFRQLKAMHPMYRRMAAQREEMRMHCTRLEDAQGVMQGHIEGLRNQIRRTLPQTSLSVVEVNIVSHCNLNCTLCSHFAPMAKEEFLGAAFARRDFKQLAALSNGAVDCIHIMGGEPLLHPACLEFLIDAREFFPFSTVKLVTNGLLLPEQSGIFWSCLADNRIVLAPTKYPIGIDWRRVETACAVYGVELRFFNDPDTPKTMTRYPLDLAGRQDPVKNFLDCSCANVTPVLHKGKLYACPVAATARVMDMGIEAGEGDYIDIFEVFDMEEILAFLARPIPFCRYCKVADRVDGVAWKGGIDVGEEE